MNKKYLILLLILCLINNINAQKTILFIGGIAHIGDGTKIENSIVSIKDGVFDIIADANKVRIDPNAFDTIIKIYGEHIYPGFISPNNTLGITEIDQVRASRDYDEVGSFNPNVRSLIAFNTDSKILKTVRTNGVLITQSTPRGGVISGSSSIMHLDGWNWEDAVLKSDDGIHLNWPTSYYTYGWWANPGGTKKNKDYNQEVIKIKEYFEKSKAYYEHHDKIDLQLESMKGLFNGKKILYVHADYAKEIRESINYFKKIGIHNIVIIGAKDALNAIDILKENNVPVILNRVHSLPLNEDHAIDQFYTLPAELHSQGILFCLSYSGDMEAMGSRNLPFTAGTAIAYGLDSEIAVSSISLNTAIILGIDKTNGSIEKGKDATFFISDGDALDMKTNHISFAYIRGNPINLDNHQKQLFEKYNNH